METARSNRLIELGRPTNHKFFEFMASLPCVSYELDQNFITDTVSSNIFELLGIQQESILHSRGLWHERLFPADRDRLIARLNEIATGALVSEVHRIINDRGLPIWVSHSVWKINTGNRTYMRGSIIPLTPDVRTKFLDTETISQFIHKIGNHFQLISLLIGSIRRNTTASGELDALEESVQRAVEFTHSFCNFCYAPAKSTPVNLGEILISVSQSVSPLFAEKDVLFNMTGERSSNGTFLFGDSSLLEFAFASLLENALDAAKSGDVVSVESKSETPGPIPSSIGWISITDTGCGMAKDVLEKAAAPFFTSKRDRNGLGLTMAIRVIEMHGGLVNISSEENRGTRVDIVLPVCSTVVASER
jgi:signal transduction histidine kinase